MIEVLGVEVHFISIILAMIVNIAVGMLWYGPLFGKIWLKMTGMKQEDAQMKPIDMAMAWVVAFLMTVGLNSTLQFSEMVSEIDGILNILATAGMITATFMAPVGLNLVIWEKRNPMLFLLNMGHFFVTLIATGIVLSFWI